MPGLVDEQLGETRTVERARHLDGAGEEVRGLGHRPCTACGSGCGNDERVRLGDAAGELQVQAARGVALCRVVSGQVGEGAVEVATARVAQRLVRHRPVHLVAERQRAVRV